MTGHTQLFEASSAYQVLVLAAALDSGAFGPADARILLYSANGEVPEIARPITADPIVAPVLDRFDRIASYNALVHPLHPKGFRPRPDEQPIFQRAFRAELGIPADHTMEIALESVYVPPARSLLNVFSDAQVTVYAEGLMSYGPTRDPLTAPMAARIERVLHLDLVPGVQPLLLGEYGVPTEVIPDAAFTRVVRALAGEAAPAGEPYALVLGQYLAELGLVSADAEAGMYGDLLTAAAARGIGRVVFKPHPSSPPRYRDVLARRAQDVGVQFDVDTRAVPAEVLYERERPALVLGCFSTGLVTASRFWGIPAVRIGTAGVLDALPLYEDSNRIPIVLVDLTVPDAGGSGHDATPAAAIQRIITTVGYAMQWRARFRDRVAAAAHLAEPDSSAAPYVPRERLRMLALPGGWPVSLGPDGFDRVRDVVGRGRETLRAGARTARTRLLARGAPTAGQDV